MPQEYRTVDALTLPMLSLMALDELRTAATHRRIDTGRPVFLGLVHTEAYWLERGTKIRQAITSFRMGDMVNLFDKPIDYPLLDRFHTHLTTSIWMVVNDLQIVDGSSFVDLPTEGLTVPVYTARDNDVALRMQIDRDRGQFRIAAAIV